MKRQIRAMVAAGYDSDQITSYFVSAYGDFVLMAPVPEGFNLVVWLFPVGFFGLGGLAALYMIRRGTTRGSGDREDSSAEGTPGAAAAENRPGIADDLTPWIAQIRSEASED
jgi:cytochrome c-type biogenesis protein CcmH/NrfF